MLNSQTLLKMQDSFLKMIINDRVAIFWETQREEILQKHPKIFKDHKVAS